MKKLKKIELSRFDLNPNSKLSSEEMSNLHGSAGCICFRTKFYITFGSGSAGVPVCTCDQNPFGLCSSVNGCSYVVPGQ